jgi:hypothetical protein
MNTIFGVFLKHPEEEGMTYFQHMRRAFSLGGRMLYGSICLFVHGLVPAFHQRTGTRIIGDLHEDTSKKHKD